MYLEKEMIIIKLQNQELLKNILRGNNFQKVFYGCSGESPSSRPESFWINKKIRGFEAKTYFVKTQNMKECSRRFISDYRDKMINEEDINKNGELKHSNECDGYFYAILYRESKGGTV